jgi:hypothetical protein
VAHVAGGEDSGQAGLSRTEMLGVA